MAKAITSSTTGNESQKQVPWKSPLVGFDSREFACGWGAAFINITMTYPIYKIIFRQMLHGVKVSSAYDQIRKEGIVFLYRGLVPPLAQKTISLSLMFGVYEGTRKPMVEQLNYNPYTAKLLAGIIAGSVETILMPFERVQTLLADSAYHTKFNNTAQAFNYIWTNHGVKEFYRGFIPILLRNGPSNSLFFLLREEASVILPKQPNQLYQSVQEFSAGAIIGALISTIFYPLNVIKVYMQSSCGGPYENSWQVLKHIYRDRGYKLRNIYKGVSINGSRAFVSWGIMNTAYEQIKNVIF